MASHVTRMVLVLIVLIIASAGARYLLIPPTFGDKGHFRADNIGEWEDYPSSYAESKACKSCHLGKHTDWSDAGHKTVNCETCHGPALAHSKNPVDTKPNIDRSRDFCGRCHEQLEPRKRNIPTKVLSKHNTGTQCVSCHNPHDPAPKTR